MKNTRKTALSAILAALSAVIMYAGSLVGTLDIATAVISSLCVMITLAEFGYKRALSVYAVTTILCAVLVPSKTAVVLFGGFFGYYPVLKTYLDMRFSRLFGFIVKYAVMNVALGGMVLCTMLFVYKIPWWLILSAFALCNGVLWLYDFAIGSIADVYYQKLRSRIFGIK